MRIFERLVLNVEDKVDPMSDEGRSEEPPVVVGQILPWITLPKPSDFEQVEEMPALVVTSVDFTNDTPELRTWRVVAQPDRRNPLNDRRGD